VAKMIDNWANAWVEHDVERYLNVYVVDSSPLAGYDYKTWKRKRAERISEPKDIKINIAIIEVKPLSGKNVGVQFIQQYSSQGYSDNVIKQLIINSDFKIVKERIVPRISRTEAEEIISWMNNK
jgi:hypothetical protein